jgi:hypothetical protein
MAWNVVVAGGGFAGLYAARAGAAAPAPQRPRSRSSASRTSSSTRRPRRRGGTRGRCRPRRSAHPSTPATAEPAGPMKATSAAVDAATPALMSAIARTRSRNGASAPTPNAPAMRVRVKPNRRAYPARKVMGTTPRRGSPSKRGRRRPVPTTAMLPPSSSTCRISEMPIPLASSFGSGRTSVMRGTPSGVGRPSVRRAPIPTRYRSRAARVCLPCSRPRGPAARTYRCPPPHESRGPS